MSTERPEDADAPGTAPATAGTERAEAPVPADPPPPHRRRAGLLVTVALVFLVMDVVTKVIAAATLEGSEPVRILGGLAYLQLVRNPGAAFGMGVELTWVLAVVKVAVAVAIIWFARRIRSAGWAVGLGLVLAGALGNVVDRIFRAPGPFQGHVVDFFSVFAPDGDAFPVFNVADSAVSIGAVLIVVLSLLGRDYDGTSTKDRKVRARGEGTGDEA